MRASIAVSLSLLLGWLLLVFSFALGVCRLSCMCGVAFGAPLLGLALALLWGLLDGTFAFTLLWGLPRLGCGCGIINVDLSCFGRIEDRLDAVQQVVMGRVAASGDGLLLRLAAASSLASVAHFALWGCAVAHATVRADFLRSSPPCSR